MSVRKSLKKGGVYLLFMTLFLSISASIFVPVWCGAGGQIEPADVDGDGKITLADMERVLIVIREGSGPEEADVNKDGRVDLEDLDIVTQAYQESEARETNSK